MKWNLKISYLLGKWFFPKQEESKPVERKIKYFIWRIHGILASLEQESSTLKSLLEEEKSSVKHLSSELQGQLKDQKLHKARLSLYQVSWLQKYEYKHSLGHKFEIT